MDRSQIGELFLIAPVANVPSMLRYGILSNQRAARLTHRSVALQVIQQRREHIRVAPRRMLHDYANLYFCARNPMMFYVVHHNPIDEVCLLRIAPEVLDLPDVVVSDGNASSDYTRFDSPAVGLPRLDFERVHARYWNHDDVIAHWEHSRVKCAEVLLPDSVPVGYILGAYAPTADVGAVLMPMLLGRDVRVAPYPFFR